MDETFCYLPETDTFANVNWRDARYWQKCARNYDYAIVSIITTSNGTKNIESASYRASTIIAAQNKIALVKRQYNFDQHKRRFYILTREQYNYIVGCLTKNINPVEIPMADYHQQASLPSPLQNKNVHVIWNMTKGCFVNAYETEAAALTEAQDLSRRNPIFEFLLLKPSKKVFQPVNVTIQDVQELIETEVSSSERVPVPETLTRPATGFAAHNASTVE